jgi:membrane protease subunit (stomatin/prohibitin family)
MVSYLTHYAFIARSGRNGIQWNTSALVNADDVNTLGEVKVQTFRNYSIK